MAMSNVQGMQDTAHVPNQHATSACNAAQPKSMVERPSSSIMSDAIEAVYGRQEIMEALPVEAFQCQLWEPAKSVLALEPGKTSFDKRYMPEVEASPMCGFRQW